MTQSEWEKLAGGFGNSGPQQSDMEGLVRTLLDAPSARATEASASVRNPVAGTLPPPVAAQQTSSGDSTAATILRTAGMATGVGPLVMGLMKLFGGGDEKSVPAYAPIPFSLPEQVSVEAGLSGDRSFTDIGYTAQGGPRALPQQSRAAAGPQIQINVNAMDSQSFADRSDDIARAVREAMLRSHSLNDVIAEM